MDRLKILPDEKKEMQRKYDSIKREEKKEKTGSIVFWSAVSIVVLLIGCAFEFGWFNPSTNAKAKQDFDIKISKVDKHVSEDFLTIWVSMQANKEILNSKPVQLEVSVVSFVNGTPVGDPDVQTVDLIQGIVDKEIQRGLDYHLKVKNGEYEITPILKYYGLNGLLERIFGDTQIFIWHQ